MYRKHHHDELTFSLWYAFHENFVLPLSHDEVVHGKGSLIGRMPGDAWQQFANLRLLYGYMWTHPGKKLLFMGGEFGQRREWTHEDSLEWHVLEPRTIRARGRAALGRRISTGVYRENRAPCERTSPARGFRWVQRGDWEASVLAFLRQAPDSAPVLVVCNFTPVPRHNYRVGVPQGGRWREILNSDAEYYGGSGVGNQGGADAQPMPYEEYSQSLTLTFRRSPCSSSSLNKSREKIRAAPARVVIESVRPQVDGGRYPIKRAIGDEVVVEADVFADGHDAVVAELLFKFEKERDWHVVPMEFRHNDHWAASFRVEKLGRYQYTVRGWTDPSSPGSATSSSARTRPGPDHRSADRLRDPRRRDCGLRVRDGAELPPPRDECGGRPGKERWRWWSTRCALASAPGTRCSRAHSAACAA